MSGRDNSRHSSNSGPGNRHNRESERKPDFRRDRGHNRDRTKSPPRDVKTERDRSPLNKTRAIANKSDDVIESGKKKFASRCRLFVGNLSNEVKETDLREIFEKYGDVVECFMSGKGFGFVRLETRARAELAKENLDGYNLKGRPIRVRYAVHGASVKVTELSPYVSNELLAQAFSMFGDVERAVHILDEKSQPTGEGIVEFERKPGAVDALRRINEGIFLLTTNPRPVFIEPLDPRDDEDGLSDRMLPKNNQYQRERSQPPRFAVPGSFEFEFGNRWKELYQLERVKKEQLERELKEARDRLDSEMELAYQEYQAAQLREDLKRRQAELEALEASRRDRLELMRMRDEEQRTRSRPMPQQSQNQMPSMYGGGGNFQNSNFRGDFHGQNIPSLLGSGMNPIDNVRQPARTEDQLVHGVQKLMQMMQNSNQARGPGGPGFPPVGVPNPLEMQQRDGGMHQHQQQHPNLSAEFFTGMSNMEPRGGFGNNDNGRGGGRGRNNNRRR